MSVAPAAIIVALSFGGHWFSDVVNVATVQLADAASAQAVAVRWQLCHGDTVLAGGAIDLSPRRPSTELKFSTPAVRVKTAVTLEYQTFDSAGAALGTGELAVTLYPPADAHALPVPLEVAVWDRTDQIAGALRAAGADVRQIRSPDGLVFSRPAVIIVGEGSLSRALGVQDQLLRHAEAGATLVILRQDSVEHMAGLAIAKPADQRPIEWCHGENLTQALRGRDWSGEPITPILVPASRREHVLARLSDGAADAEPDIRAVMLCAPMGRGQLILCQLPLGSWENPLNHVFLRALLERTPANASNNAPAQMPAPTGER